MSNNPNNQLFNDPETMGEFVDAYKRYKRTQNQNGYNIKKLIRSERNAKLMCIVLMLILFITIYIHGASPDKSYLLTPVYTLGVILFIILY